MPDEKIILNGMAKNIADLQNQIETLCRVVEGNGNGSELEIDLEGLLGRSEKEKMLASAIMEAIEELEHSRKSFKSKQLERLRKKLTRVLIEAN